MCMVVCLPVIANMDPSGSVGRLQRVGCADSRDLLAAPQDAAAPVPKVAGELGRTTAVLLKVQVSGKV